jgi:hypothetical protein
MAIFGEYDLRNEFTINTAIESLIKILSITVADSAVSGTNLEIKDITKRFNSLAYDHYLNDGYTLDDDTVSLTDTNASDLNRLTPAFSLTRTLDPEESSPTDSGGIILKNPYAEAGWFLNDNGSYVGEPITFT